MKNYLKYLSPPQSKPIPGQTMIQNNAGGYVFEISDQEQLERFLIIGSEGGSYYVSEEKLTADNATRVIAYIKSNGKKSIRTIVDFAVNNRAPKYNVLLFCYALTLTFGDETARCIAYGSFDKVIKTPTHLFQLLTFLKPLRGWSRGLRSAISKWYLDKKPEKLAYHLIKYRNRSGYCHKDVIRLAHPKATCELQNSLLKYAVGRIKEGEVNVPIIQAYGDAQKADDNELCNLIRNYALTWEMVPTESLNKPKVLEALLPKMPTMALLRNLNRYTYTGLVEDRNVRDLITSKLTNPDQIAYDKIHPINVMNTFVTYRQGHGDKGSKTWKPDQKILDALSTMYDLSTSIIEPTGKKLLVGIDVSGSMCSGRVAHLNLNASQVSFIIAHTLLKIEFNVDVICFDTTIKPFPFGKRNSVDSIIDHVVCGGGTNCALPLAYALKSGNPYDAILIFTDSETWAGDQHSFTILDQIRKRTGKRTNIIEIALVANPNTNFPSDKNILRVVGFDASVMQVINDFLGR